MDLGKIYDQHVADTYDEDALGLLAGARNLGIRQIIDSPLSSDSTVLDLGVGTGETLIALAPRFPSGRRIGIDLSARMIDVAQRKLTFEAHVDDACNAAAHVPPASVDLALAHFLTTFVDRPKLFRMTAGLLRPGGLFSVVSTPTEAFHVVRSSLGALLGDAALVQAASPTPANADALAAELTAAGFEIRTIETFRRKIVFENFDQCLEWGLKSGFFAHAIEAIGMERIKSFANIPGIFPLADEYVGVAVLASPRA